MGVMSHLCWELSEQDHCSSTCNHGIDWPPLDFQLLLANRIVDTSWRQHKVRWTRADIADLLFDALDEFGFDWARSSRLEDLKFHLVAAYKAAYAVLPEEQRDFN